MRNKGFGNISMQGKGERPGEGRIDDPCLSRSSWSDPTVCKDCAAVYHEGRWQWAEERPKNAHKDVCPACYRIHEKMPAGFLTLGGDFFLQHRNEIMRLIHHTVETQEADDPLKRIMGIKDADNGVVITFTDMRLLHDVGMAIQHVYKGDFTIKFPRATDDIRASWVRHE